MTVALVANATFNITNFRWPLMAFLRARGWRVVVVCPPGPERARIEAAGYDFVALRWLRGRGVNPLRDALLVRELARVYRREGVDLALHYTIKPVIFGSLGSRSTAGGARVINTVTGLGYAFVSSDWMRWVVEPLFRRCVRAAALTLFHNADDRNLFLARRLVAAGRSGVVAGSGVDLVRFAYRPIPAPAPRQLLFVGRLLVDKGIREYVAAALALAPRYPGWTFHVVGRLDTEYPAAVTAEEVAIWRRHPQLVFHNFQEDVRPFIEATRAVVLPSYREGLPRVLLEAAALGRPLVSTDVPGCREVVVPGQNGYLVPARNTARLREAMRSVMDADRAKLERMGLRGRALVEERFGTDRVTATYWQHVQTLTGAKAEPLVP